MGNFTHLDEWRFLVLVTHEMTTSAAATQASAVFFSPWQSDTVLRWCRLQWWLVNDLNLADGSILLFNWYRRSSSRRILSCTRVKKLVRHIYAWDSANWKHLVFLLKLHFLMCFWLELVYLTVNWVYKWAYKLIKFVS